MDNMWKLPASIELGGVQDGILTDFREILDIIRAMADTELNE